MRSRLLRRSRCWPTSQCGTSPLSDCSTARQILPSAPRRSCARSTRRRADDALIADTGPSGGDAQPRTSTTRPAPRSSGGSAGQSSSPPRSSPRSPTSSRSSPVPRPKPPSSTHTADQGRRVYLVKHEHHEVRFAGLSNGRSTATDSEVCSRLRSRGHVRATDLLAYGNGTHLRLESHRHAKRDTRLDL